GRSPILIERTWTESVIEALAHDAVQCDAVAQFDHFPGRLIDDALHVAAYWGAFTAMWHHFRIEPQLPISVLWTESRHDLVLLANLDDLAGRNLDDRRPVASAGPLVEGIRFSTMYP